MKKNPDNESTDSPFRQPLVPKSTPTEGAKPAVLFSNDRELPERLIIPSIGLDSLIEHLGTNTKGEMDVPSGTTMNVGWYKHGTIPGSKGSAVIDAHVYAGFKMLHALKPGSDIYIVTGAKKTLHFVARSASVYAPADVPLSLLFERNDLPRLNLITCAGKLTPDGSTYDHRLIVYTELVSE